MIARRTAWLTLAAVSAAGLGFVSFALTRPSDADRLAAALREDPMLVADLVPGLEATDTSTIGGSSMGTPVTVSRRHEGPKVPVQDTLVAQAEAAGWAAVRVRCTDEGFLLQARRRIEGRTALLELSTRSDGGTVVVNVEVWARVEGGTDPGVEVEPTPASCD